MPEHTLAAYLRALEDGADGLECDVRLTRDGHLVCVHDRRIDRTSNGRGPVAEFDLADLGSYDFASWKGDLPESADRFIEERALADERVAVLTLERLLELIADCDRPVEMAIETKHPTRYAGKVERTLVELLDRFGWAHPRRGEGSPVRVMSFSQMSLRRLRFLAPRLPTVLLMERVPLRFRDGTLPPGVRIAGPSIEVVRVHPRFVERLHRAGAAVHVWTVDHPGDVELCVRLGVEAIITNRPRRVLDQLGR
jgi:glycerophosphoryl diester phosphodiesterase